MAKHLRGKSFDTRNPAKKKKLQEAATAFASLAKIAKNLTQNLPKGLKPMPLPKPKGRLQLPHLPKITGALKG